MVSTLFLKMMLLKRIESSVINDGGYKMLELPDFWMTIELKNVCGKKKTIEILKHGMSMLMVMWGEISKWHWKHFIVGVR